MEVKETQFYANSTEILVTDFMGNVLETDFFYIYMVILNLEFGSGL